MRTKIAAAAVTACLLLEPVAPVGAYGIDNEIALTKLVTPVSQVQQVLKPDELTYASENGLQKLISGEEIDFKTIGVINMFGHRYTYYSSNVLYHYRTLEWYACDDGIYRTEEGYIVCASDDYQKGTIVDTPFGKGIILDCGCDSGTIDIYVNF